MNVAEVLEKQTKESAHKPAVIFKDQSISFRQLRDASFKLADSLIKLEIRKGDKIAIYLPNCPQYIFS
jgi:acyl-CoA synthetase (AMP-forming)/AMP-acid ligase II